MQAELYRKHVDVVLDAREVAEIERWLVVTTKTDSTIILQYIINVFEPIDWSIQCC